MSGYDFLVCERENLFVANSITVFRTEFDGCFFSLIFARFDLVLDLSDSSGRFSVSFATFFPSLSTFLRCFHRLHRLFRSLYRNSAPFKMIELKWITMNREQNTEREKKQHTKIGTKSVHDGKKIKLQRIFFRAV